MVLGAPTQCLAGTGIRWAERQHPHAQSMTPIREKPFLNAAGLVSCSGLRHHRDLLSLRHHRQLWRRLLADRAETRPSAQDH